MSEETIYQGFLIRSYNVDAPVDQWEKNWVTLDSHSLRYINSNEEEGVVDLAAVSEKQIGPHHLVAVKDDVTNAVWFIKGQNEEDMTIFLVALSDAVRIQNDDAISSDEEEDDELVSSGLVPPSARKRNTSVDMGSDVIREGFLTKFTRASRRGEVASPVMRYFVLSASHLKYYQAWDWITQRPLGKISLSDAQSVENYQSFPNSFVLTTSKRQYKFGAFNEEDKETWIASINIAFSKLKGAPADGAKPRIGGIQVLPVAGLAGGRPSMGPSPRASGSGIKADVPPGMPPRPLDPSPLAPLPKVGDLPPAPSSLPPPATTSGGVSPGRGGSGIKLPIKIENLPPAPAGPAITPKGEPLPPKPTDLPPKPTDLPPKPTDLPPRPTDLPPAPLELPRIPSSGALNLPAATLSPPTPKGNALPSKSIDLPPQPTIDIPRTLSAESVSPRPKSMYPAVGPTGGYQLPVMPQGGPTGGYGGSRANYSSRTSAAEAAETPGRQTAATVSVMSSMGTPFQQASTQPVAQQQKPSLSRTASMTQKSIKKNFIVAEIIESEQAYVDKLQVLVEMIIKPLQSAHAINAEEIRAIFGKVEPLLKAHQTLLEKFREASNNQNGEICQVFLSKDVFQDTINFMENYGPAQAKLEELRKKKSDFEAFLKKAQATPKCAGEDAKNFLFLPSQRLPRYSIFLKEMIKHVTEQAEKDLVQKALEAVSAAIDASENAGVKIVGGDYQAKLASRLFGMDLDPPLTERTFIKDGTCMIFPTQKPSKGEHHHIILCQDIIIVCDPIIKKGVVETSLKMKAKESIDPKGSVNSIPDILGICALQFKANSKKTFFIGCYSQQDKKDWIQEIQKALDSAKSAKKGGHKGHLLGLTKALPLSGKHHKEGKEKDKEKDKKDKDKDKDNKDSSKKKGPVAKEVPQVEVPPIITDTIAFLETHGGADTQGLFRIAGMMVNVKKIKKSYDKGKRMDFAKENADIHDVAGAMKLYLHEMEDPLLTTALYDSFISAVSLGDLESQVACIKRAVDVIPPTNRAQLIVIFKYLVTVSHNHEVNKMTPKNVAIVFMPNLIRPKDSDPMAMMKNTPQATKVIELMITHFDTIFSQQTKTAEAADAQYKKLAAANNLKRFENAFEKGSIRLASKMLREQMTNFLEEANGNEGGVVTMESLQPRIEALQTLRDKLQAESNPLVTKVNEVLIAISKARNPNEALSLLNKFESAVENQPGSARTE